MFEGSFIRDSEFCGNIKVDWLKIVVMLKGKSQLLTLIHQNCRKTRNLDSQTLRREEKAHIIEKNAQKWLNSLLRFIPHLEVSLKKRD